MRDNESLTSMVAIKMENGISVARVLLEIRGFWRVSEETIDWSREEEEELVLDMLSLRYSVYQRSV